MFRALLQRVWLMCCSHRVPRSPGKSAAKFSCKPHWRNCHSGMEAQAMPLLQHVSGICWGSGVLVAAPETRPIQGNGQCCCEQRSMGIRSQFCPTSVGMQHCNSRVLQTPASPCAQGAAGDSLAWPLQPLKVGFSAITVLAVGKENLEGMRKRMLFASTALARKKLKRLHDCCCLLKTISL